MDQAPVRFAVFADLHIDIMHDALQRVEAVITEAKKQKVDFIIQLGDLSYPDDEFLKERTGKAAEDGDKGTFRSYRDEEKRALMKLLNGAGMPVYHVLGNHEGDACSMDIVMAYYGMTAPYYSFDCGGFHFVVLDANYFRDGAGREIPYENCNYQYVQRGDFPLLPKAQLAWLEADLLAADKPSVLFSHQALTDTRHGVINHREVRALLKRVNTPEKRVVMALNGHSHCDGVCQRDGVYYLNLNSISNIWLGKEYSCVRYSEELSARYPYIVETAPYRDPLFAIVTLTPQQGLVKGVQSAFVGPSPEELGLPRDRPAYVSTPHISDRVLDFTDNGTSP